MLEAREYLPIGTVVSLSGGTKKAMIIGIIQSSKDKNNRYVEYDYIGVIYPEGFLSTDTMFMFNHNQIKDVVFKGYENMERDQFIDSLQKNKDAVLKMIAERSK